ncbi:MAG: helix-turn-helix transcriptional regulator [Alphaproteobacteria bacterium]|nr:helix-turn-helix transcriptional regulator [Alphaproteobacteria bacterium]
MEYGQFCPIAKASEILGEKWTILIIRELLMGATRFSQLQRGLGSISPTILTRRLAMLDERGMIYRKRISGQRGYEYHPTEPCRELMPILLSLGGWGVRWAQSGLTDRDYDVHLLMVYLERSIVPDKLPGGDAVIRFRFSDLKDMADWWIVVTGDGVDVCTTDPGRDVDVYFNTTVKTMTDVWNGLKTYNKAITEEKMVVTGPRALTRNITAWMQNSVFTDLSSASKIFNSSGSL